MWMCVCVMLGRLSQGHITGSCLHVRAAEANARRCKLFISQLYVHNLKADTEELLAWMKLMTSLRWLTHDTCLLSCAREVFITPGAKSMTLLWTSAILLVECNGSKKPNSNIIMRSGKGWYWSQCVLYWSGLTSGWPKYCHLLCLVRLTVSKMSCGPLSTF